MSQKLLFWQPAGHTSTKIVAIASFEIIPLDVGTVADPGFPRQVSANPNGGASLLLGKIFAENNMKLKEFGLGGARVPDAPFGSGNEESSPLKSSRQSWLATFRAAFTQLRQRSLRATISCLKSPTFKYFQVDLTNVMICCIKNIKLRFLHSIPITLGDQSLSRSRRTNIMYFMYQYECTKELNLWVKIHEIHFFTCGTIVL